MLGGADASPSSSALFAFKPRQVLLLEHQQQQQRNQAVSSPMARNKPEDESILICSVALWLENKGFSKVLKRFLSAVQIQDDDWKAKALNLNEIFSKYLEICSSAHEDLKSQKKKDELVVDTRGKIGDENGTTAKKIQSKKKTKKSKGDTTVNETGRTLDGTAMSEILNESYVNGNEDQSHKTSGLSHKSQNTTALKETNDTDKDYEVAEDQSSKKQKEKKKKKSKLTSQSMDANENQADVSPKVTESEHKGSLSKSSAAEMLDGETTVDEKSKKRSALAAEDHVDESKKASKKRKRMAPDENENKSGQEVAVEESKSKKPKGLQEGKGVLQQTALSGANGHTEQDKGETFQAGQVGYQKVCAKQSDKSSKNAINDNGMDNPSQRKSASRQPKSSDPKTVQAFQRVKVDEVEFVDERLQDNSYWAKDGADNGYGAKAQEVLGQVKGRDFRHEKTKKKRGSYRGGQIDLQSHSIKFNYSDEE